MFGLEVLFVIALAAFSAVVLFVATLIAVRRFYVIPRADEALVKTGGREPVVSAGGGMWVIPLFHRVAHVSLRAVKIPIERTGADALPTANKIPAELRGELIVRVSPDDPRHIILAAQALGPEGGSVEAVIAEQVDSLVTDALRTAAFKKTFQQLNAEKKEFADEVTQLLAEDLAKLGLTLTAVTIPHLKQGEFTADKGDVFAAEGQRNVAETVAKNRQETNLINRNAEVGMQEQDVNARKRALELELNEKRLVADNLRNVTEYEAQQATETKKSVLAQQQTQAVAEALQVQAVQKAEIDRDQKIFEAKILRDQQLAVQKAKADAEKKIAEETAARQQKEAEIARAKAVEAAQIAKDQAIKVADEQRLQGVAEAEIAKQIAIAARKKEEADARAHQASAEAEQKRAEESIITAKAEMEADRQKRVVTIKAEEDASKLKIAADRDAYVQTRKAEADRDATLKQAEAVRAQADGKAQALKLEAEGEAGARLVRAAADLEASDKEAKAKIALASAILEEGRARAEAQRLMVEAQNAVATPLLVRDVATEIVKQAPSIVREFMAPVAAVSDVKVLQINGLGGNGHDSDVPSTVIGTGLAMSGALPLIKAAVSGLANDPDAKDITAALGGLARTAIRETAGAVKDGIAPVGAGEAKG